MHGTRRRLGEIFIEKKLATPEQVEGALKEQSRTNEFLGKILLKRRIITQQDLLAVLSEQFNMPIASLKNRYLDFNFIKSFSPSLILDHKCLPLSKDEWSVTVAITDPLDIWAVKKAEEESRGFKVKPVLVAEEDMNEALERYRQWQRK